jgi:PAS domain S-box-containing protein
MIRRAWALLSVVPIFVGACILLGWLTESPLLIAININYLSLGVNFAACLLLAGIGLLLFIHPTEASRYTQIFIGVILVVYCALTISQDIFHLNLHIDQLAVMPGVHHAFNPHPDRMAPNTALAFSLLGLTYMLLPMAHRRMVGVLIETLIFLFFLISIMALAGYVWKMEFLYSWSSYRGMSLTGAVCFVTISAAISGIWRSNPAAIALYQGREDTRIILLSSAILLCMALAITIANFSSLIRQQDDAIGLSFERLQKTRSVFFQNEIVHAIQEMNVIRGSQLFQDEVVKDNSAVSVSDFQPILKLFAAEGFSAVTIYNSKGVQEASMGSFVQQAVFNIKEKITNGYINILWKNGWYVQIASDIDPKNKKLGLLVVEWPLTNINKVFAPNQMMGASGDVIICMPATGSNVTCFSSRNIAVSTQPSKVNDEYLPIYYALQGQSGLLTADDNQYMHVLAAFGPIGVLHLGMVIQMSVTEIYEPITKSLHTMVPVIALTILIGLLLLRLQAMPLLRRVINAERSLINSNARLEESEQRYALAVRGSSTGLWDWDIANDTVFYSPYYKGMLGYSDVEFANTIDSFRKSLHPDDFKRVFDHIDAHINSQVAYDIEFRLKRKTGDYHWFHAKGLALTDEQGNALRMAGSILDVTDRKKSEQRLAAQYAVIQLLSTASSLEDVLGKIVQALCENLEWDFGSAWLVDSQAAVIRCIDLWYQPVSNIEPLADATRTAVFGIGEGLSGRVWETGQHLWVFDVSAEKDFPRIVSIRGAAMHSAFCFPIRVQNKVLGTLEFMMRQRQGPDEAMLKMMAAITTQIAQFAQRKAAEWSLRENESYKAAILESASDSIMTVNALGGILSFNHRTSEIFGYPSVELSQSNVDLLMPGLSQKLKHLAGKMASEVNAVRKDGESFPIEITISKMYLSRQNVFVCIVRDITERKKIEKLKNEFVSVVSHELRTPITSIRGSLGLLLGGTVGEFNEKSHKLLDIANNNCERLLLLINDILDIEKIEAGKMDFQFKPTDVTELVRETVNTNKIFGEKYNVKINFKAQPASILVYVDPDRLIQVLINLISNAVKFSQAGGVVNLAVELSDDLVRVSVSDHGAGIPEDFRASIFQKFSQADSSTTRGRAGTGLGLSISKAIIEKFGGTLNFTSKPNDETVFYFELPRWHQAEMDDNVVIVPKIKIAEVRLLICESDVNRASYLQTLLEPEGYSSDVAYNVTQAKKMLHEKTYQALLLDLVLPDKGGVALIRELRNEEAMRSLPVIVISVQTVAGRSVFNGEAISVIDWLDKPVDFNKLLKSIEHIKNTSAKKMPHILHVEDDADTRRIIATLLQEYATITEVDTLAKAREKIASEKFDLVILDLLLPDGNGAEILPVLAKYHIPIILFSAVERDQEYARYFHDALEKSPVSSENLLGAIKQIIKLIY